MKENVLKSTGRTALAAAFLLVLLLPARARAQRNGQAPAQAPGRERHARMWLRIMAFTDAPVVGADVRVTVHGRLLVDAKAATNRQGVFPAPVWRAWLSGEEAAANAMAPEHGRPSRDRRLFVRISISGGTVNGEPFPGHLSASIAPADLAHQILVVNPVTTLVSRILDERPDLRLHAAEALVRRFLKLPANYSLGLALRQSSHYASPFFSPVAFMAEARDTGGLNAFEHLLLRELALPSARHPFRNPKALGSTGNDAISIIQGGLYAGLMDYASSKGVSSLAGWALSLAGFGTSGSTDDITALTEALADLQSSIDDLKTQVAQLTLLVQSEATKTLYNLITVQTQTLANSVNDQENRLMYLSQDCPPLAEGNPQPPPAPGSFCATEPAAILVALNSEPIYSAYTNVESAVRDNGTLGLEGMLHLYSLWLGQSRQFFRAADSTKMQSLYDYWNGVLTQAADLKIEALHQAKEQESGGANLIALMGNPNATPPTTGLFQADQAANLKLMFPPVPDGTAVDTADHSMWALLPWAHNFPPLGYPPTWLPQPQCQFFSAFTPYVNGIPTNPTIPPSPYAGFSDWQEAPTKAQWQAAFSSAPTGTQWRDWLIQQTKTTDDESPASSGFFDWTRVCSVGYGAWTTTTTTLPNYWVMDPVGNGFYTQPPDGSPAHTAILWPARTLATGEQYFWYN